MTGEIHYVDSFWGTEFCDTGGFDALAKRMRDGRESCRCFLDFIRQRARTEEEYARNIERLNKSVEFSAEIGTLRASADALKLDTDKTSQEHNTASRDLAQHVQTFGEFMEMQKKNRAKMEDVVKKAISGKQQAYTKAIDAKRKYYEKSQQSDTAAMTLKDAQPLKHTYTPRKWESMVKEASRANKAASDAESQYRDVVDTVDVERNRWEREMTQYAKLCEEQDVERYRVLHDEMWHLCNIVSSTCVRNYTHCEAVMTSLKAVDANKDMTDYVSKAATGTDRPAPVEFESFQAVTSHDNTAAASGGTELASQSQAQSKTVGVVAGRPVHTTTVRRQ